jgi:hypothetical protein
MLLIRRDGTRVDLGHVRIPAWDGVTIRGVEFRCGAFPFGIVVRCELPVGHDGPVMPRHRHVGRDDEGRWHTWEALS